MHAADAVDEGGEGEEEEGAAEDGAGGEPGDGDDDEGAGEAEDAGDESGAEADDAADEGDDVAEDAEGAKDGAEADGHEEEADEAQAPGERGILAQGVLEHEFGGHGAALHALDFAAGLGGVGREGVAGLLGEDAVDGRLEDLEGDAQVAHGGRGGIVAEVDAFGVDAGLGFQVGGESREAIRGRRQGLVVAHLFDDGAGDLEGAEGGLGGEDGEGLYGEGAGIGVILGMMEAGGVDGFVGPRLGVFVAGGGFLAAAEFLLRLGGLVFLPLVHLHVPPEAQGDGAEAEEGIADGFGGGDFAAEVDELVVIGRHDGVGRDGDDGFRAFLQAIRRGDGTVLIPEKEEDGNREEDEAEEQPFEGAADAAEPGLRRRLEEAVGHMRGEVFRGLRGWRESGGKGAGCRD